MHDEFDQCAEVVTVDGAPALVHSDQPLDDVGRAAIEIVIRAAREKFAADRPTDEDVQRWADRLAGMPMSAARSWAGRLLNELVMERQRNDAKPHSAPGGYVVTVDSSTGREVVRDYLEVIEDESDAREALDTARHGALVAPPEEYRLFALHEVSVDA